jgi:DNA replication protein DnaC
LPPILHIPFDSEAPALFFALVSSRYEHRSLVVWSNKSFSAWAEIFAARSPSRRWSIGSSTAEVIVLKGESHRLPGKREEVLTGEKER